MSPGTPPAAAKEAAPPEDAERAVPAYYEVWGGLESANRALWVALWFALTVALLALLMLRVEMGRPPVVIRIDPSGQDERLSQGSAPPPVGPAEVKNFLTLFERFFTALNCYTCDDDLKTAFAMMTPSFQEKAAAMLKSQGTVEQLKAAEGKTTLTLTEVSITRETPQVLECDVKGYREVGSYKADAAQDEVVFDDDVVLAKVPRSEQAPYGMLVEDYHESLFKK